MSENRAVHPVATMCRVLGVSPSGYHAWTRRTPSRRAVEDAVLRDRIVTIHAAAHGTYGAPRIHAELADEGIHVGRKRVARLMRAEGVAGVSRRRIATTTVRDGARPAPDLADRTRLLIVRMRCGWPISRMFRRGQASSISRSCSMCSVDGSLAGRWRRRLPPSWCSMLSTWRSGNDAQRTLSIIPTRITVYLARLRQPLPGGRRAPLNGFGRRRL